MPLLGDGDRDLAPGATAALARAAGRRPGRDAGTPGAAPAPRPAASAARPASRLRDPFLALTRSAGLREASGRAAAPPDCGVLVGVGEPDRERLDAWTRAGTPYVVVRLTEGRAVVGPFVVAGHDGLPALRRRAPHRRGPGVAAAGPAVRRGLGPRPCGRGARAGRPAARRAGAGLGGARPGLVRRRRPALDLVGHRHAAPPADPSGDPRLAAAPRLRVQLGVSPGQGLGPATGPFQGPSDTMGP